VLPADSELRSLLRRDPALRPLARRHPFPGFPRPPERRRSLFHSLARAILYQQLAGKAAATIHDRVVALGGGRFPRPEALLALPEARLRAAGVSRAKVAALRDLAARAADGRLRLAGLHRLPDEEVVARLTEVRGIGPWTAHMFLIFRLGRLDVLPVTDLGVQEGLRRLDGQAERPDPEAVAARAACWAPLRSVGSWWMWRACEILTPDGAGATAR